jgi:hypothetical protein
LLETAGRHYKRPFHEQVQIYSQKPQATALLDYNGWQKRGGQVLRGSTSIKLADRFSKEINHVFDISDNEETTFIKNLKNNYFWKVKDESIEYITNFINDKVQDILEDELITNSAESIILNRCGIKNLNKPTFEHFKKFSLIEIEIIGEKSSEIANTILLEIEKNMKEHLTYGNIRNDNKRTLHNPNSERENRQGNRGEHDRGDVRERGHTIRDDKVGIRNESDSISSQGTRSESE